MRILALFLSIWLGIAPAFADSAFVAPTANGTAAIGQLPGTTTNDNASTGNLGEYAAAGSGKPDTAVTITIASPGVITDTAHGLYGGVGTVPSATPVQFTTSGALPTGITASTTYYVIGTSITANTYQIATSVANALAGTAITTSGSQSGTQTRSFRLAMLNATTQDIGALGLTAGDWDIFGTGVFYASNVATSVTSFQTSISTTAVTQDTSVDRYWTRVFSTMVPGNSIFNTMGFGTTRVTISAGGTVFYGNLFSTFGVSTMNGWGIIQARRRR